MSRKLISGQRPFRILVANLRQGSDPSKGPAGNPQKVRETFTIQHFPEIPGRGEELGNDVGIRTRVGHVDWAVDGVPVAANGTITISGTTFTGPTWVQIGSHVLVSGEDWSTDAVQSTASATVVATPSTATLTIGAQALTDAGGARTPGANDYNGTLGTVEAIAADIVAAINDPANGFAAIATAEDGGGGLINLTAVPVGSLGDAVTLVTSDAGDITVSAANFSGGVDTDDSISANIATAINAIPGFSATPAGAVVTVTGPPGVLGNEIALKAGGAAPYNLTLAPTTGSLAGGEPVIGPVLIG